MKKDPSEILDGLEQHLLNLSIEADTPLKSYEKSLLYLIQEIKNLKADIVSYCFVTTKDEINFFKNIKPQLNSKLIYYNTLYKIEPEVSLLSTKKLHKLYSRELLKLQIFFEDNKEFYNYYKMKHSHFDKHYFLRGKHNIRLKLESYLIESDPLFSTSHDYKLAEIMANEELKIYFEAKIPQMEEQEVSSDEVTGNRLLTWTASQRDLIEIIHAFHGDGVFNNGKVTLKFIAEVFEQMFGMSAGDIYNGLDKFHLRKGEPTYFLNRLKKVILKKLGIYF